MSKKYTKRDIIVFCRARAGQARRLARIWDGVIDLMQRGHFENAGYLPGKPDELYVVSDEDLIVLGVRAKELAQGKRSKIKLHTKRHWDILSKMLETYQKHRAEHGDNLLDEYRGPVSNDFEYTTICHRTYGELMYSTKTTNGIEGADEMGFTHVDYLMMDQKTLAHCVNSDSMGDHDLVWHRAKAELERRQESKVEFNDYDQDRKQWLPSLIQEKK